MLKAIIFDMDGVLIDSSPIIRESFISTFHEFGIDIRNANEAKYLGRSLSDQLNIFKEEYSIDIDIPLDVFRAKALAYQLALIADLLHPDPYIQRLIKTAKDTGIMIAVATSSSKKRAIIILEGLEIYPLLDAFVTCEDVEKSKPSPDIFLKAAEMLHIDPSDCIVIEDAVNGIQAAKAAGMKSAGKIGREHTREELSIADITFSHFDEITLQDLQNPFI